MVGNNERRPYPAQEGECPPKILIAGQDHDIRTESEQPWCKPKAPYDVEQVIWQTCRIWNWAIIKDEVALFGPVLATVVPADDVALGIQIGCQLQKLLHIVGAE